MKRIKTFLSLFCIILVICVSMLGCKEQSVISHDDVSSDFVVTDVASLDVDSSNVLSTNTHSVVTEVSEDDLSSEASSEYIESSFPEADMLSEPTSEHIESSESIPSRTESSFTFHIYFNAFTQEEFERQISDDEFYKGGFYKKHSDKYYIADNDYIKPRYFSTHYGGEEGYVMSIRYQLINNENDDMLITIQYPWTENNDLIAKAAKKHNEEKRESEFIFKTTCDGIEYTVTKNLKYTNIVDVYWNHDGLPFLARFENLEDGLTEDMLKYLKLEKVDL